MALEIGVLGPLEVRADGAPVGLGGPQARRVLALLVAEGGRVVGVDRLVDAVWSDAPPESARRTVMTYVWRLRRSLSSGSIATQGLGYRLTVPDEAIDARRFEGLVEQARSAPPTEALNLIDRALGLWRGRAFGEFADEWWALSSATRLEELRVVASERRAQALIAIGECELAVTGLEALIVEHPLRERVVALLMQAHAACGRQADALRTYASYRASLGEETGLEPSHALHDLETSILLDAEKPRPRGMKSSRGYILGAVLGEGAFATVYRATQPGVGRDVAVKVIRAELADDPGFVRRFETEAQLAATLEHPHIVPLHDFWREPGGAYLVFRLLRGGTAAQHLADKGRFAFDRVDRLVTQIGDALAYAHAAGVLHRDVRPANVLFDEAANAYLTDFGIAATTVEVASDWLADCVARSDASVYAPPEVLHDGASSPRGDQYSFAAMIWELLAGAPPFAGERVSTLTRTKLERPVPSLRAFCSDVPTLLDGVLQRATAIRADDRYENIEGFVGAWRTAMQSATSVAHAATNTPAKLTLVNPFRGLRPFVEADARYFYGRDDLSARLTDSVLQHHLVTVVGASGSGKSSLLHAGLVPRLRRRGCRVVSLLPGEDPAAQLRSALLAVAARDPDGRDAEIMIRSVAAETSAPLVVLVDQCEELWTIASDDDRDLFLTSLAALAELPTGTPVHVVIGIRADFFDRPLAHRTLGALVADNTFGVTPMTESELHDAVVAPAAVLGVGFEPGLDRALVSEVVGEPASLPMLQFTLAELFERRHGNMISHDCYEAIGGIVGAIATRAEEQYALLDSEGRDAARRLLLRLVVPGDGAVDTRRRVRHSELPPGTADIAARFAASRLLVADRDPTTREPTVEIAHESLLRSWPRLRAWLDDNRDALRQLHQLTTATDAWNRAGQLDSELYRGARLETATELLATHTDQLTDQEHEFVVASQAATSAAHEHERRTRQRLRRRLSATALALVIALIAGVIAGVQRNRARSDAAAANAARITSDARSLAVVARTLPGDQLDLALLLAVEARHLQTSDTTDGALEAVLAHTTPGLDRIVPLGAPLACWPSVSSDGHYAASTINGFAHLVDLRTGRSRTLPNPTGAKLCAGPFSANGDHLVSSAPTSGDVVVWDTTTGRQVGATIHTGPGLVGGIETRPGRIVIAHDSTKTVTVWDTRDPAHPTKVASFHLRSTDPFVPQNQLADVADPDRIAIGDTIRTEVWNIASHTLAYPPLPGDPIGESPDGSTLVTRTSTQFRFWNAATGTQHGPPLAGITPPAGFEYPVWFSPNGHLVAVKDGPTNSVRVVDLASRRVLLTIQLGDPFSFPGPFLRDGRLSVFDGQAMSLWRVGVTEPAPFATVFPSPSGPSDAEFTPDGSRILAATSSGLDIWDATSGARLTSHRGGPYNHDALPAFSADGRWVASAARDGTVHVLDAASGRLLGVVPNGAFAVTIAWSPRDPILATVTATGGVALWNVADPAHPARLVHLTAPEYPPGKAANIVFSPDGRDLAVSGGLNIWPPSPISLLDVRHRRLLRVLRANTGALNGGRLALAAFSPDSRTLAAAVNDTVDTGRIVFWDVTNGRLRTTLTVPYTPYAVAYVNGGRWLAVSEQDVYERGSARIELRDAQTLQPIGDPIRVRGDAAILTTNHPGGSRVATGTLSAIGSPIVWDLNPADWEVMACRLAGRNLSRAEWNQYLPDRPYQATCAQWPTGQ
jgi:serine/threonine protein kinase/DNA-binding SARP family transcriptional activator/WD40 repeat protein